MRAAKTLWLAALALSSACTDRKGEAGAAGSAVLVPVTWTNAVGVSTAGDDLTKTAGQNLWNAGASSVETLAGDGYVEFTTDENTTSKIAGLGIGDVGQGVADIEFGVRMSDSGNLAVFESGTLVYTGGAYAAGDRVRVQVLDGVVTYWQNGSIFYTSTSPPSFPLLVDTSLRTPGATIRDVAIEDLTFWKVVHLAHAVANDLVKTDASTLWNAGAVSRTKLTGDGFVGFTTGERNTEKAAGLSHGNNGNGLADVDFAILLRDTHRISVFEAGINRGSFGTYVAGDIFRVQVAGGQVTYWKNGNLFYTSGVAPTMPLLLDTSLKTPGATINDAVVVPGVGDEVCPVQAQRLTGEPFPGSTGGHFGWSLDAAPGLLVAGAPAADPPYAAIYRPGATGWEVEQVLTRPADPDVKFRFVHTDGQTIAVGDFISGEVLVYRYDGQGWTLDGQLTGCPGFGGHGAVQGELLVAEAGAGAAVFRRGANAWLQEATISLPEPGGIHSMAIGGDRIFLGTPYSDTVANEAGAVYVYRRRAGPSSPGTCDSPSPGAWQLETVLHPSNARALDHFAWSGMDANGSGTQVIVGNAQYGLLEDNTLFPNGLGTAHLFSLTSQGWQETFKFEPSLDAANPLYEGARFGDHLAFGGPDPDVPSFVVIATGEEDAAWIFRATPGGSWDASIRIDGLNLGNTIGIPVAATDDSAILGAPNWRDASQLPTGAVYDYDMAECPAP
jgi:hypothetical protein